MKCKSFIAIILIFILCASCSFTGYANLPDIDEEKFLLVMEVHSHNTMGAVFSRTDDKDEIATRLYTVIGRLDKVFPDMTTRISVGGKHLVIDPAIVFDSIGGEFPEKWKEAVEIRKYQKEEKE